MKKERTLSVSAIKNGTVIDHIPCGSALRILKFIDFTKEQVTIGLNLKSRKMQFKDIIKIQDRQITSLEIHQLAILAPTASVNIIHNYEVVKKVPVTLPETIESILLCPNKKCVTRQEKADTFFFVHKEGRKVLLRCKFCEKCFEQDELALND